MGNYTIFYIRKDHQGISEEYVSTRNRNILNKTVSDFLAGKEVNQYIANVTVGTAKDEDLDAREALDYRNIACSLYIHFKNDCFTDNTQMGNAAYEVLQIMKGNRVKLQNATFTQERSRGVYEVRLEKDILDITQEAIYTGIQKIK